MLSQTLLLICFTITVRCAVAPVDKNLRPCGEAYYLPSQYSCYNGDFLCPVLNGEALLRCGHACYRPEMYSCNDGGLTYPPTPGGSGSAIGSSSTASSLATSSSNSATCTGQPTTLHLSDPPYENYFYSDCHSASQVVLTSPLADSNLTIIGPRLLVAWPAGNSGVVSFFAPQNGVNGSLGIELVNGTSEQPLTGVYSPANSSSLTGNAKVGISTWSLIHI